MAEQKQVVQTYEVNFSCENRIDSFNHIIDPRDSEWIDGKQCQGSLIAGSLMTLSNPPYYQHSCNQCYGTRWLEKKYPLVEAK